MAAKLKWKLAQWFELRWWNRYLRHKNKQQYLQWKKAYWQQVLQQLQPNLNISTANTIADIGCGPAGIFIALPNLPVTAVDPLLNEYQANLAFFDPADYPGVNFVTAPMETFAPPVGFDLVFCMNAINHVYDINEAFDTLKNIVKPGGKLVVSIDAHNHNLFKRLFKLLPGDVLHPHQYNLAEYRHFITSRGFKILQQQQLKSEFIFNHYVLVAQLS